MGGVPTSLSFLGGKLMKFMKRAAIVGASGLVAGLLTVTPATAVSADMEYDCFLGENTSGMPVGQMNVTVDSTAPASIPTAATSKVFNGTATVTVPESLSDTLRLLADSVQGTAEVGSAVNGAARTSNFTIASYTLPATGSVVLTATGPLYNLTAGAPGTKQVLTAGSFLARMTRTKGGVDTPMAIFCQPGAAKPEQDLTFDTVTAGPKLATTTAVKASYVKSKKTIKASITVSGGGYTPTGQVSVVVKRGTKTIKKLAVTLRGGKAAVAVKKIRTRGKYKVIATYKGGPSHTGSKKAVTVRVR